MPCTDVTEILSISLDTQDRVAFYSLTKRTCGGTVGNPSLLRPWIEKKSTDEILTATVDVVLSALPPLSDTWEFLAQKHLLAIQCGLATMLGKLPGLPADLCAVESISTGPGGLKMIAHLKVDLLTEAIPACGGCSSCGSHAAPSPETAEL